ncbi:Rib/alpha-like domain-containing protein [Streptococcus sp. 5004]|uniref:Rib/alpha-like domain-containing protein n=1 Tax=Streptococcus sp. 5004 TaxID=2582670 RepID=UPI001567100F|nr:Rib/alpha-like domain-containing protein [Streptococcus sp. 5004]
MFKPKVRHVRQSQVEKFTRYSIRKVSFGAASVAVATGLFFLGGGSVQAAEPVTNPESTEVQNLNAKSPDPSKEVAGQVSATATVADGQNNTSVKESATDKQASEVETPTVVTEKVTINTASLEDLVAKVESRLSQLTEGKKTKSVIDDAKNLVHKAKELLNDDTKTQAKVAALAKQLSSSLVILNSIKSEVTEEEKVNKNQDPRNGKEIPGKGESGFRDTGTVADGTENPVAVNTNDITQKASELEAEIAKVEALISAENAKREGEKDKGFIEILTQVKESAQAVKIKGDNIPTTEKEKHALLQELKAKVDLLKLYQAKKLDWGAPANNHLANYGNNPTNAIISNLNNTFGTPDFSGSDSHEKVVKNQRNGLSGTILGSAKYHWKEKNISVSDASAGALDGWKIVDKPGKNIVTLVKPEQPTDIQRENGVTEREYNPNSAKVYDNNGKANMDGQGAPNASGKLLNTMITTPKFEAPEAGSGTVNKDFYLELRKQGTTIYKDFDVNPNSHLYAHLLYAGAYGKLALASTGEKVKLKIVDAYTGTPLAELKRKDKKAPDTEFLLSPGSGNRGVSALRRVIQIPKGTTKVRVFIEAADQPNGSNLGGEVEDGYIVAGLGLTTGPALSLTTTVVSGRNKEAYGFTNDAIYKNEQAGILEVTLSNRGGLDVSRDTKYKVTVTVPQGVKLGSIQGKDLNEANGFAVFAPSYTTNFRYDKQTRELTFEINILNRKIEPKTGKTDTVKIPFIVTPDFVGEATFKITGQNGFGGKDALGNAIYPYGFAPDANRYNLPENFRANSLETSDNPDYKYNRSIYIDSMTGNSSITVPVGTSLDKIKELSKSKAKEKIESEEYKRKLDETNATATLDDQGTSTGVVATDVAKENAGVIKVPVVHSRDGKNYKNTVDIEVNVVKSTTDKLVVFEGDKITNDQVKSSVTPATIDTKAGVVNNPNEADVFSTTGKAGEAGLKIPTTVTHDSNGTNINETVTVPVLVLPKATGEVQVHKGASVDKVKEVAKAKAQTLTKATDFTGKLPTGATVTVGDITEAVAETLTNEKGTNKGIVNVPANYIVEGKTYNTTIPVTINVLGSETKTVYTLEGTQPKPADVNEAITPDKGGNLTPVTEADINKDVPTDKVKVGATDLNVKATVKYPTGDETVDVPVKVLPKATPTGVTVLKDTDENALTDAVKAKATEAVSKLTNLPDGITASLDERETSYTLPKTDSNGDKDTVPVKVLYKDDKGNVVGEDTINVPVKVVSSTPKPVVVFEGDKVTKDDVKGAVTTEGTKGEPAIADDITAKPGVKEVTVPVTYTDQNGETLTEPVKVKVTVLPKPTPKGIFVAKDSDKEKAKEKALAKAKEAIADGAFKGKLPENVTNVSIDENVTSPDLSDDTDVNVTVKYTVDGEEKKTVVKVPVTVVEGVPQIVPVDENNKQPNPENSIDKTEYPDGSTFEYNPNTPVDTTKPGDYTVNVIVKDKDGNPIAEVPATVRVVESYPQFVPVDKDKKQPNVVGSIDPKAFPKDTEFSYESPVDTTTPGEKDVVVVAKIGDEVIAKIPAKVMVVEPKTQYVPVDKSNKQPDASKSIDPEQYPDGVTFKYKTPVDTTTPGEKDVIVEAKDGDDTLVEVPTKVKVVQGYPQIIPVDQGQPLAENSINTGDYPEGATFEYEKVDGKDPVNISEAGDYPVTVVVKDKDGNTLVKVPTTVRVVDAYRQYVPVNTDPTKVVPAENIVPTDFPDGTTFEYKTPVDTSTPGDKDVVVVAKLDGKPIAEIPAKVTVVGPKTQYVVANPENTQPDASKSLTDKDKDNNKFPDDATFGYKEPVDTKTPGEKDATVVVKDADGDTIVEVPAKVKVVEGKEQLIPVNPTEKPQARDNITPSDYPEGSTFEYKIPDGQKEPFDATTVGDKPVTVVVKDKNGKVLVEVPATIKVVEAKPTPIETPVTNTPLTKEDIAKYVKVPEGGKIVGVGEIPKVNTPGDKGTVKVKIELPNGKQIEVEVPVKVTPIKDIVKKLGDPITNEDVEKHIQIPEGGKIISIGDKPSTDIPGERPSVPVVIELPGGKRVTIKVPVVVTPKTTPIVVEVGTPITENDVKKHVDLPEGWKITKVGEIPKTSTPGDKPSVTVEIELPDGRKVTVEVPVKVTPKSNHGNSQGNNGSSTIHIVTRYQDGDGKEISPEENGSHGPKTLEGYEYIGTKTDENGNVIHTYKKVTTPTRSEQPSSPETPISPEKPVATPVQTSSTDSKPVSVETTVANDKKELPNTGTEDKGGLASLGLLGMLSAFGLVARKKKED